ncbi:hypothetical protein [Pseudochrobactrum sp. MP213Fo]|uniref:hypothetical protein n=1 Tax=Pseudochrobactrum sp. MP213Fo TaxID=3022250 RepID=UPI003BA142EB
MKISIKILIAYIFTIYSTLSFSEIIDTTYFAPIDKGNLINFDYKNDNKSDLNYISAPLNIDIISPKREGTRFIANQFNLVNLKNNNDKNTMYMGLNVANSTDGFIGQVHFSLFGAGYGKFDKSNCNTGADSGDGVTCAVKIPVTSGYRYNTVAEIISSHSKGTTVQGRVEQYDSNGNKINSLIIGSFEVLKGEMGFTYPSAWVEGDSTPCNKVGRTQITYSKLRIKHIGDPKTYETPINTVTGSRCGVIAWPSYHNDGKFLGITMTYPAPQLSIESALGHVNPPKNIRAGGGSVIVSGLAEPHKSVLVQIEGDSDGKTIKPNKNGSWSVELGIYDKYSASRILAILIDKNGNELLRTSQKITYH